MDWTDDMPKAHIIQVLREKEASLVATERLLPDRSLSLEANLGRWLEASGFGYPSHLTVQEHGDMVTFTGGASRRIKETDR